MDFLEGGEKEALTLRFVEEWEYHEIAAARNIPIGTVQWRVFNSKKKLAAHLRPVEERPQVERRGAPGPEVRAAEHPVHQPLGRPARDLAHASLRAPILRRINLSAPASSEPRRS